MLTKQQILDEIKEKKQINSFRIKTSYSKNPEREEYAYDEVEIEKRYQPNNYLSHNRSPATAQTISR